MVQVLWYRKDLFAVAGIEAPATWDELVEAARTLTVDGRFGIAVPAGRNLASDQVIYSIMITSGAEHLFDAECNVTFNTPETVRALQLYKELLRYSPPDATVFAWGEPQALFNAGQAAMAIEKGQYLAPFEAESGRPAEDLGMARIPLPAEGGRDGSIYYSNAVMVLTEDPAKQAAAAKFIRFLLEPETYGRFVTAEPGLFLPLTQSGLTASTFWEDPIVAQYRDHVQGMIDYSAYGALFGFTGGIVCSEIAPISALNLLAQTVQQMAVHGMTPEQAAAWGQERMEDAVMEFRRGR
jgi:multiple sugar transport system substrate-binding protein